MLPASECCSVTASGVAASTWAAIWLARRRVRSAVAATPPAISTMMVHCASQIARDGASITGTGWASACAAAAADSSATAAPPTATGAFTIRTIRGARSHRHAARTAMPVPVPTVRARPQRIRLARRSGAACTLARLAAHGEASAGLRPTSVAGSRPLTSPATMRPVPAASRSQRRSGPTGQVSAAAPRSAGASAAPASTMVNSSAGRACATGTAAITMAGPASMSSVPHTAVARCAASAAPAATALAAAAACRATCQARRRRGRCPDMRRPTAPSARPARAPPQPAYRHGPQDAALPFAFMTGECQRFR